MNPESSSLSGAALQLINTPFDRILGTLCDVTESLAELMSPNRSVQVQGMKRREIALRVEDALKGGEDDVQRLCAYLETVAASLLGMSKWENPSYPVDHIHEGKPYLPSKAVQEQIASIQEAPAGKSNNITFTFAHMSHYVLIALRGKTVTNVEVIGQNGEGRAIVERWKEMNT